VNGSLSITVTVSFISSERILSDGVISAIGFIIGTTNSPIVSLFGPIAIILASPLSRYGSPRVNVYVPLLLFTKVEPFEPTAIISEPTGTPGALMRS